MKAVSGKKKACHHCGHGYFCEENKECHSCGIKREEKIKHYKGW